MDSTVPAGAARLLDFIRATEVGTDGPSGYGVIYGFNQSKLPKPVTSMTVDEVLASQAGWSARFGSSAAGGYQFMKATLSGLKSELGLGGGQVLDGNLQDRLGYHLLKRRGYEAYAAGTIAAAEFGKRLAMEWASFPVLAATKGAHLQLARGQSYYAGDRLNKALVTPARVEAVLAEVLSLARSPGAVPIAVCKPEADEEDAAVSEPQIIYVPTPAPIGHNGGPALDPAAPLPANPSPTPVEQASKAVGAGKWTAIVGASWAAISAFLMATPAIPEQYRDPALLAGMGALLTTLASIIGAYVAPANAVPVQAPSGGV